MKKIKLLFQGDSITDAGRDKNSPESLGGEAAYARYAAEYLTQQHPDVEFEFLNLGCGGNQTKDLVERLESDFIEIQPDIVSILIGINDVWHYAQGKQWLDNDLFEQRYRRVLEAIRERTRAKILILEPFLIPAEDKLYFREDLNPKIDIVRKLALEYADVYLPTDGLLYSAFVGDDPLSYAADGVHPTKKGAQYIWQLYARYVSQLITG